MANKNHLRVLSRWKVDVWNTFVQRHRLSAPNWGANLKAADLRSVELHGVDLSHADLRGARLSQTDLRYTSLWRANLRGADLTGVDLRGADLVGSKLDGAKLKSARLAGARLRGVSLQEADLSGCDLSLANLIEADLSKAILTGAELENAMFRDANLAGSDLTAAQLRLEERGPLQQYSTSFLDLATCRGLRDSNFGEADWLSNYLDKAFEFAHRADTHEAEARPTFIKRALGRIRDLRTVQQDNEPSPRLIQALDALTARLIDYLKRHPKQLFEIDPRTFEELVAEVLASYGWQVDLTTKSGDGGYDIFALSPTGPANTEAAWIIECKRWARDRPVGVDVVRALYGSNLLQATVDPKATAGMKMLATTSHFTKGAKAFKASRYDLALRDYAGILDWLNEYRPNPSGQLWLDSQHQLRIGDEA